MPGWLPWVGLALILIAVAYLVGWAVFDFMEERFGGEEDPESARVEWEKAETARLHVRSRQPIHDWEAEGEL